MAQGKVRACWIDTGIDINDNWGEVMCLTDNATTDASYATGIRPVVEPFGIGNPQLRMPDNIAFHPGTGIMYLNMDATTAGENAAFVVRLRSANIALRRKTLNHNLIQSALRPIWQRVLFYSRALHILQLNQDLVNLWDKGTEESRCRHSQYLTPHLQLTKHPATHCNYDPPYMVYA